MFIMDTVTATEMKQHLSRVLNKAMRAPVKITRKGSDDFVVLSMDEFERLEALDDAYWSDIARKARKAGTLGTGKTALIMSELMSKLENA